MRLLCICVGCKKQPHSKFNEHESKSHGPIRRNFSKISVTNTEIHMHRTKRKKMPCFSMRENEKKGTRRSSIISTKHLVAFLYAAIFFVARVQESF